MLRLHLEFCVGAGGFVGKLHVVRMMTGLRFCGYRLPGGRRAIVSCCVAGTARSAATATPSAPTAPTAAALTFFIPGSACRCAGNFARRLIPCRPAFAELARGRVLRGGLRFDFDAAIAVGVAILCTSLAARTGGERDILFAIFLFFSEVGDVKESIALQADIDKCRLHAGKDTGDFAFVNGAGEGVFVFALVIDFRELVVFDHRQAGFVGSAGDINFFCHAASFQSEAKAGGGLGGMVRQISAR